MPYALETRAETLKNRQTLETNEMKVGLLRKLVGKTKIDRIRNQKSENHAASERVEKRKKRMGQTYIENGC